MPKLRVTKRGRVLLFKALRAIKKHPRSFSMATFMRHRASVLPSGTRPAPYCGTVACIAGHVVLAAGGRPETMGYYHPSDAPAALKKIVTRAPHGYASIQELAAYLLVGRWNPETTYELFHDFSITRNNVDAKVRRWLRTGTTAEPRTRGR